MNKLLIVSLISLLMIGSVDAQQITTPYPPAASTSVSGITAYGTTTGTAAQGASSPFATPSVRNILAANVLLNNTGAFFDGPSAAQGSSGTWFASGSVDFNDTTTLAAAFICRLWDGTTVIASALVSTSAIGSVYGCALSGAITSPAGNIRISVQDLSSTSGIMYGGANGSGSGADSTVTAVRIN